MVIVLQMKCNRTRGRGNDEAMICICTKNNLEEREHDIQLKMCDTTVQSLALVYINKEKTLRPEMYPKYISTVRCKKGSAPCANFEGGALAKVIK